MLKETSQETVASAAAKLGAPITVTGASIAGYPVSDILLWATLFYTVLMIAHKLVLIVRDVTRKDSSKGTEE
jgi:putative exporter of polyketide antibiotics